MMEITGAQPLLNAGLFAAKARPVPFQISPQARHPRDKAQPRFRRERDGVSRLSSLESVVSCSVQTGPGQWESRASAEGEKRAGNRRKPASNNLPELMNDGRLRLAKRLGKGSVRRLVKRSVNGPVLKSSHRSRRSGPRRLPGRRSPRAHRSLRRNPLRCHRRSQMPAPTTP